MSTQPSNSIKYGGRPPRVELGVTKQNDGFISFWVRDNGDGIPKGNQINLFKPFEGLT